MKKYLLTALTVFGCATAMAANTIENCVIQEVLPSKHMTAAFFTLKHTGETQKLVAADIPSIASLTEIHTMEMVGDVMKMKKLDDFELKEGDNVFKKGGNHLMLLDIKENPKVGSQHTITLTFNNGDKLSCEATVKTVAEIIEGNKDTMDDANHKKMEHHPHHKEQTPEAHSKHKHD